MDFQFNDEQRMWHDVTHNFMEKEVGREYTREHDANREFPNEVYKKMADMGWLGLLTPEEYGGMRCDPIMFAIFCEAIGKFSLDTAACIMTSMFTANNIVNHGTAKMKESLLPAFLNGDQKFAISISEPQSGSDAAAVRTKAVQDGDDWVLNGNKVWCSGAHLPNTAIVLLARTSEDRYNGLSLFLIPNDTPGLIIKKMDTIVRRSLGTTEFFLDNLRIPKENLIGEIGKGWKYIAEHLDMERLSITASQVGNARTALDDTIKYTKEREAFGKKLSQFQVLKHRMAENEIEITAARLMVYSAASKMAQGENASKEVSMAKVFAADVAFKVAFNGMQALGGYAQLPEYDMERYFREAKHGMVGGGTREIQCSIIAKHMGL
ncbi:acyl-CoA dehydrogenase family protein [Zhongshania sp.]|jgi:alkylation response protein AidB-like acyl-CoA dehydrogenase|uniref:acyl-CoA dehydrogenase family protein n=1 Tax=Zhongshania sp. TaxID=1971902 RepID=UPI002A7EC5BB|nr:acyl-CoA dehydrogenase family protein [Zhongshania sp.]